jgi:hypothetical protein
VNIGVVISLAVPPDDWSQGDVESGQLLSAKSCIDDVSFTVSQYVPA